MSPKREAVIAEVLISMGIVIGGEGCGGSVVNSRVPARILPRESRTIGLMSALECSLMG